MKRNYFSDEQIKELEKSEYVKKVTQANVSFTEEFKQKLYDLIQNGYGPTQALLEMQIRPKTLGQVRVDTLARRIRKEATRVEGFQRSKGSGRPAAPNFNNAEEEIKYLKDKLEYQKQEIEFLKKWKALETKYQRKKNTK